MIYNIIVSIILAACLLGIGFIFLRKFRAIRTIDVNTIAEEKAARVKERILVQRIYSRVAGSGELFKKALKPSGGRVKKVFSGLYRRLQNLEKKYQKEAQKPIGTSVEDRESRLALLLTEASAAKQTENYSESEKKYIEILSLAPGNLAAYRGLAELYREQKEYDQAIQTLNYILKLLLKLGEEVVKQDDLGNKVKTRSNADLIAEIYLQLGEVSAAQGEAKKSFEYLKKALSYGPNDPKTLDLLIASAIIQRMKIPALDFWKKLKEVNPDNQKLGEYAKTIADL
jgi:tetratricopeptide (TPR) repeat protein